MSDVLVAEDVMCGACGWLRGHHYHDVVHARLARYHFQVDGVEIKAVLPWGRWPSEWQEWMVGLVAANKAKLAEHNQWRLVFVEIDAYRPAGKLAADGHTVLDAAINYQMTMEPVSGGTHEER